MAAGRFKLHQIAGGDFAPEDNASLVNAAKQYLQENLGEHRNVSLDNKGRIVIGKYNPIEENKSQQAIALLLSANAETQALRGLDPSINQKLAPYDKAGIGYVQEAIGRGLFAPTKFIKFAGTGSRDDSKISVDNLSEKAINDQLIIGRGFDPRTGAPISMQVTEGGHTEDHNLHPELSNDIHNILPESRTVNKRTSDVAKGNSDVNPKYRSIIALRNGALDAIRNDKSPVTRYTDDDGELDVYGSSLDQLIDIVRAKERAQSYLGM